MVPTRVDLVTQTEGTDIDHIDVVCLTCSHAIVGDRGSLSLFF